MGGAIQNGSTSAAGAGQQLYPHRSCHAQKRADFAQDPVYSKCRQMHPQMYFNNLGILHLKLRKYALASFHFSKALRFLEVAGHTASPSGASSAGSASAGNSNTTASTSNTNNSGSQQ